MMLKFNARPIFIILFAFFILVVFLNVASKLILMESFIAIEEEFANDHIQRVINAIDKTLDPLMTSATDYGCWDDAYQFVQDGNAAFIESNFNDDTLQNLNLNIFGFVKNSGAIVHMRALDMKAGKERPVWESLLSFLTPESIFVRHNDTESQAVGILMLPEGPFLIVSRPVLTGKYEGPIFGAIIMGRFLDAVEIKKIAEMTKLPFKIYRIDTMDLPPDMQAVSASLSETNRFMVQSQSNEIVSGYGLMDDVFGNPAFIVRVDMARGIYQQGMRTAIYFTTLIVGVCLLCACIGLVLYRKIRSSREEKKQLEERYRSVISQATDCILLFDAASGHIIEGNAACLKLLEYDPSDMEALTVADVFDEDPDEVSWAIQRIVHEQQCFFGERKFRSKNNESIAVELSAHIIHAGGKQIMCMIARDISERKKHEGELLYMANHDPLTGLPNRTLLLDRLNHAIHKHDRSGKTLAVLFLDLDQFKVINDNYGHAVGDKLLQEVAARLQGFVRKSDTIARLGGDEFTIIIEDAAWPEAAMIVANKALDEMKEAFKFDDVDLYLTASIGVTCYPADATTAAELLKNADIAMYHAKEQGRNNYQFFSQELNTNVCERLTLENGLRHALEKNQFVLHYQPIIEVGTGRMNAVEALLRWQHPERGLVPPMRFIPLAEETGLILPIGAWVLRTACAQNKAWRDAQLPFFKVTVNVSMKQLMDKAFAGFIKKVLVETGLDAGGLEIEITESVLMTNPDDALAILSELKLMGVSIAIDDFGTGYSSLMQLRQLPIDILKVDKCFIDGITQHKGDETLVNTIIQMGHNLGLNIVAEGVETIHQMNYLIDRKCHELQGYYFSKPVPAEEIPKFLQKPSRLNT